MPKATCQRCGAVVLEAIELECLQCGGLMVREGQPEPSGRAIIKTELSRCLLCRAEPDQTTGGHVVCRSVTCPLCGVPMRVKHWERLMNDRRAALAAMWEDGR